MVVCCDFPHCWLGGGGGFSVLVKNVARIFGRLDYFFYVCTVLIVIIKDYVCFGR